MMTSWQFVLPRLLETDRARSGKCTMRLYFTLYHEATLANLLQVALFHGHICEQAGGDLLMELADYCARKMTMLISGWVFCTLVLSVRGNALSYVFVCVRFFLVWRGACFPFCCSPLVRGAVGFARNCGVWLMAGWQLPAVMVGFPGKRELERVALAVTLLRDGILSGFVAMPIGRHARRLSYLDL